MHPALDKWESSSEGVDCLLMLICVVTFVKQAHTARGKSWRHTEVLQQQIGVDHLLLRIVMYTIHFILSYFCIIYILLITVYLASSVVTEALLFWVSWLHMASPGSPVCHQSEDECPDGVVRIVQTHYELDVSDSQVYHNSIHAYSFIITVLVYSHL